jgi:hypothetical protein
VVLVCASGEEQWSGADITLPVFADQTINVFGITGVEANMPRRCLALPPASNTHIPGVRMTGDGWVVATQITERTCD